MFSKDQGMKVELNSLNQIEKKPHSPAYSR